MGDSLRRQEFRQQVLDNLRGIGLLPAAMLSPAADGYPDATGMLEALRGPELRHPIGSLGQAVLPGRLEGGDPLIGAFDVHPGPGLRPTRSAIAGEANVMQRTDSTSLHDLQVKGKRFEVAISWADAFPPVGNTPSPSVRVTVVRLSLSA